MSKEKWAKYKSVAGAKYCNPPNRTGTTYDRDSWSKLPKTNNPIWVSTSGSLHYNIDSSQVPKERLFYKASSSDNRKMSTQFPDGSIAFIDRTFPVNPAEADWEWRVYPSDVITPYSKGEFIADIIADENTYPADGRHSDGFWYVTLGLLPPNAPGTLTVPEPVRGGKAVKTSWSAATSEGSSIAGYELEKAVDGGAFIQIYKGISLGFTDNILYGSTSVQYQVRAYDATNTYSGYTTSERLTVVNNNPPTISGTDEDKGLIMTDGFTYPYTVDDADSEDTVTVVEAIDGVPIRTYTAVKTVENTADITALTWVEVLNGIHRLTITVTDSRQAAVVRTISFSKLVSEIEFTLAVPLPADDMITKTILSVTKELPVGADFSVFACNNGNDAAPTWEDVTQSVLGNDKFFFTNEVKTAEAWGYNFKVCIKRKAQVENILGRGFNDGDNINNNVVNLTEGYAKATTIASSQFATITSRKLAKNYLKANSTYTMITDMKEISGGTYYARQSNQPILDISTDSIPSYKQVGIYKHSFKTINEFTTQVLFRTTLKSNVLGDIVSCTVRQMLLEGDWTNKELPSNYWEDMSVDISADCFVNSVGGVFE